MKYITLLETHPLIRLWFSKLLILMKLIAILLTVVLLQASSSTYGQKVTIHKNNISLSNVFKELKEQTGYKFLYDNLDIIGLPGFSLNIKDATVEEALDNAFKDSPFSYKIFGNTVVIKKENLPTQQEVLKQSFVRGKVIDEDGNAISNVTVRVKESSTTSVTDEYGEFRIPVSPDDRILVISSIGFDTKEVAINGREAVIVTLIEKNIGLHDVVVVGYGTQRRADITGAVSSVNVEDLEGAPVRSVDQMLQGRVAGVSFVQNSGMPGAGSAVRIRGGNSINGSNEPLYVIDGVPIFVNSNSDGFSLNPLNSIATADIKSIEVLKDASATAIYGSRGGNGVVLITTHRGSVGGSKITFDAYAGLQQETKRYSLLNAKQFETLANEASLAEGGPYMYDPSLNPVNTDWQDGLFRAQAPIQNYQLSISGGNEQTQFLTTFTAFDQDGIIRSSDLKRYSLRVNADHKIKEKVKLGTSLTFSNVETNRVNSGSLFSMLTTAPNLPVFQPDGSYTQYNNNGIGFNNPIALLEGYKNFHKVFRGIGNAHLSAEIIEGLTLKTLWALDGTFNKSDSYMPQSVYSGSLTGGNASVATNQNLTWLNENTATYKKDFGKHRLDALLGFTQQTARYEALSASASGFLNDNTGSNDLGLGNPEQVNLPSSSTANWTVLSWLGRLNYGFDDRYLVTLTGRYDGSSRFGKNNRWGFFPSAAFAWRAIEEEFVRNLNVFSNLKIRASYGLTGNQDGIGNYPALDLWDAANYAFGGKIVNGITPIQIMNRNLKWESTLQSDIGIDMGFFENRLTITADAYYKKTNDLLLSVTVPASSGFTSGIKNVGSLQNKGLELTINGTPVTGPLDWNVGFNISWNKNEILDLGVEDEIIPSGMSTALLKVGEPVGNFLGYVSDGLFQNFEEIMQSAQPGARPGDVRFIDFDGDGLINANDRQVLGNAQPLFFGGLQNSFNYKNLEFSFFLQYVYGNELYNVNTSTLENLTGLQNQRTDVLDRWSSENTNTIIPRATNVKPQGEAYDRYVEDGSYLRIKNAQLAYSLPSHLFRNIGVSTVRIYANAQNLFTFTNYSGLDPEVSRYASDNVRQGYDSGAYPTVHTYTFGITVGF